MLTFLSQLQVNTMKCLRIPFASPCGQVAESFPGSLLSRSRLRSGREIFARLARKPIADKKPSVNCLPMDYDIKKAIDSSNWRRAR